MVKYFSINACCVGVGSGSGIRHEQDRAIAFAFSFQHVAEKQFDLCHADFHDWLSAGKQALFHYFRLGIIAISGNIWLVTLFF